MLDGLFSVAARGTKIVPSLPCNFDDESVAITVRRHECRSRQRWFYSISIWVSNYNLNNIELRRRLFRFLSRHARITSKRMHRRSKRSRTRSVCTITRTWTSPFCTNKQLSIYCESTQKRHNLYDICLRLGIVPVGAYALVVLKKGDAAPLVGGPHVTESCM